MQITSLPIRPTRSVSEIGKRSWIALTHDRRIRYKPNERDAVMRHGVDLLVIIGAAPFPDLARAFVTTVPRIERFLAGHQPPFIAKVYRAAPGDTAASDPSGSGRTLVSEAIDRQGSDTRSGGSLASRGSRLRHVSSPRHEQARDRGAYLNPPQKRWIRWQASSSVFIPVA